MFGGEGGIRTPGALPHNGFQDRRIRPLCHFSGGKSITFFYTLNKHCMFFFKIFNKPRLDK
jgi:hypothetical protein